MTGQTVWFLVIDLTIEGANGEPYAVIKVEPAIRRGTGCQGTIISLHHDRAEAEADAASWTTAEQFPTVGATS